jgi:uncharacterized protein (TIGR02444 family)
MTTANLDNPFWTFSLAVYGAPGVADECLALQGRLQLDVNLLLLVAYAGAVKNVRLDAGDVAAAAATVVVWHGDVVRTLRRARRALKPFSLDSDNRLSAPSGALRASVKAAELEAERIEQAMLWHWLSGRFVPSRRDKESPPLAHNLRVLMQYYRLPPEQAEPAALLPGLCQAADAYGRSPTSG